MRSDRSSYQAITFQVAHNEKVWVILLLPGCTKRIMSWFNNEFNSCIILIQAWILLFLVNFNRLQTSFGSIVSNQHQRLMWTRFLEYTESHHAFSLILVTPDVPVMKSNSYSCYTRERKSYEEKARNQRPQLVYLRKRYWFKDKVSIHLGSSVKI